ncbi:DUF5107 domain-containing protein [Lutibacter citreus]|uniref:DUF5107 domain-containing protein n=1 Tax=Lutibacter citreus TaxID=2138210 RepID=UPI000DBE8E29|nr:DUF5107 domain-containing protein [Lutibacter citreus]
MNISVQFRKVTAFSIFFISILSSSLFAQVKMTESLWELPTYEVLPSEKAPMFFDNGNFQGARRMIYPNAANDEFSHKQINKKWKALTLENEYIKLCITPEMGGKLYYATDKTNNYNFIYKNNEVKPANIGMTGAWASGGIEWCVLHHHRASTYLAMDYSLKENNDGSKTIFVGETEPRHRMRWNVGVTVAPGKAYFEAEVTIYNATPYTHNFLYWANVAAHTNENFQTIFPPSVEFATYHQKNQFTRWPISTEVYREQDFTKGVDISYWKNTRERASFFAHDLKEDFSGGYDHGKNSGTVHIGDHNIIKGAKLWQWGSGKVGQNTEAKLTTTSGPYVEIMVGAFSDNQPDYSWIRPYEVKKWKHYWYPVRDIEGFKNANKDAAVNLEERDKNTFFLGYHSTQKVKNAKIVLKSGDKILLEKQMEILPGKAFTKIIKLKDDYIITDLYTELVDLDSNEILLSYKPKVKKKSKNLPEEVKPPLDPEEVKTIEELYLIGSRMDQFYKVYNGGAMSYYNEVLKRDPNDTRTNIAIGNNLLKSGDYNSARTHFSRAIKRQTKDYTRPSTGEGLYLQGLTLKALDLYDEAIDTLYRATWDYAYHTAGYFELAQISCLKKDYKKALHQINEALSTNNRNTRIIALKASIQRKLGDFNGAKTTLEKVKEIDPLNFRIGNELYLIANESGNTSEAEKNLTNLNTTMRNFDQNYLELAVEYFNEGLYKESENVMLRFKGENPIFYYYLGFIQDKFGNKKSAESYFKKAQSLSEESIFPFRLETVKVLKKALEYNSKDIKANYYLGNILFDKQPSIAIKYWEKAVINAPELAMAHRNLGWGYYKHNNEVEKAISAYENAFKYNDTDANFYNELDELYDLNNNSIETRLALFEGKNEIAKKRDDAFVRQMIVLTLAGEADKAVSYLKEKQFSFKEGNSTVRELTIDAHLASGIKFYNEKNYTKALEQFLKANVPLESAGNARTGNRSIQVNYYLGLANEALKNKKEAKKFYTISSKINSGSISEGDKVGFMNYYQGLSYLKLNKKKEANIIFKNLIVGANEYLKPREADKHAFFSIFGKQDHKNVKESMGYTTRGLGYKGLGKTKLAKEDLSKALELQVGNLWANIEFKEM